jgi:hypothetical protein
MEILVGKYLDTFGLRLDMRIDARSQGIRVPGLGIGYEAQ